MINFRSIVNKEYERKYTLSYGYEITHNFFEFVRKIKYIQSFLQAF